ncbi:MAG TPA: tetratricopeptide repeat protein [Gemmataceae bacterium]|jgi:pentatricopeptide repeat protein|nr:tetratricopeptide repeat protein [Gemmataceae bacterium]
MHRPLFRTFLVAAIALSLAGRAAADDPVRETAIKLNQVTGKTAMQARLVELAKDEAGTKKLIAAAVKMIKDEKPSPLNYTACLILAQAAHYFKDSDNALTLYKACAAEAVKLKSENKIVEAFVGMIDLHIATKKYDEAIMACQEFLAIEVDDKENPINLEKPLVLAKLISTLAKAGKADEAIKMVDNMIEKDQGGWFFVRLKGEVLREAEKHGDAADAFLTAIERLKKTDRLEDEAKNLFIKQTRYLLSNVYVDARQIDKSAEQLQILLKDDPDNPTFLNDLGFIWADHDMNIEESEKLIRKAIEKDREQRKKIEGLPKGEDVDNAAYIDSLGWVLYKKKDYKEAKKQLQEAVKLEGGKHIEIYDHLADVHVALGEKDEAIKVWKESLKFENLNRREKERRKVIEQKLADLEKK